MQALQRSLDYTFDDGELCRRALTHRSAGARHNERLEFLGDALLGMIVAEYLFETFPTADEGQLTRTRAALVNRECLAELARGLALGEVLVLGEGEQKSGGWRRDSILANTLEALIGAIYLDGGFDSCRRVVRGIYADRLDQVDPGAAAKDPKTALQEFLQARRHDLPRYETTRVSGPPHEQIFTVSCHVDSLEAPVTAEGNSRRKAEQAAARAALRQLRSAT
ncbi:MAG: ribonuclease III [Gammaproteobacteria bacterium]